MQVTQADENSNCCNRVGVEKDYIKFQSSPEMKKIIRSRSETTDLDPPPIASTSRMGKAKADIQPPLPLDPPPPDNPVANLQVKQEVIDVDYQVNNHISPKPESLPETNGEPSNNNSGEICRDFIRGTCMRQGTCRFAHKHDLSQLKGVYTFCRKYQNSECTLPFCKYVHADVFEEQHFYRTGILPPHALAHHNRANNVFQPTPPLPPEDPAVQFNTNFSNPPPPLPNDIAVKSMISCVPTSYMTDNTHGQMPMRNTSPLKREWSAMATSAAPPCDIEFNEPLAKKCIHCNFLEFRYQVIKVGVERMRQLKEEQSKKLKQIEKRKENLDAILQTMIKPSDYFLFGKQILPKPQNHINSLNGVKNKILWEQLDSFFNNYNKLSSFGEET